MINTAYSMWCCAHAFSSQAVAELETSDNPGQTTEQSDAFFSSAFLILFVVLGVLLLVCALAAWRLIFSDGKKPKDFRSEYDKGQSPTVAEEESELKQQEADSAQQVAKSLASADTVVSEDDEAGSIPAKLELGGTVSAGDTINDSDPSQDVEQPAKELRPPEKEGDFASRQTVDSMGDQSVFMDDADEDLDE